MQSASKTCTYSSCGAPLKRLIAIWSCLMSSWISYISWSVALLCLWILHPVVPLNLINPETSGRPWWLFPLPLSHNIFQPLAQCSYFVFWVNDPTLWVIKGWLVNHIAWPGCPAWSCIFSGFGLLFVNFQIISSNVFFITYIIWSLVFMIFCLSGFKYRNFPNVVIPNLWLVIHLLQPYGVPYAMDPVFLEFHLQYTSDLMLLFYPKICM